MGKKGSKLTPEATATCEQMVQALSEIGDAWDAPLSVARP